MAKTCKPDKTLGTAVREEGLFTCRAPTITREADGTRLRGYAAVYYVDGDPSTEFRLNERFVERIAAGAFDGRLGDDVRALFNHDPNQVLGRTPRTLRLGTDDVGLWYEVDLPDTQAGRDVAVSVDRGDVDGSSFAFNVAPDGMDVTTENGQGVRTITQISRLADVSPVTYPAYEGTGGHLALRSAPLVDSYNAWLIRQWKTRKQATLENLRPGE